LGAGVTGVNVLFRAGDNDGDYVTLTHAGNNWDSDTLIYTGNNTAGQFAGVRLGTDNALPVGVSVTGANSSLAATTLDLAGYNQSVNGLIQIGQLKIINSNGARASTLTLNPTSDKGSGATSVLDGSGVVNLIKLGNFTQTLSATNNYSGTTTVAAGTLLLGRPASLYNGNAASWTPAKITVGAGATLALRTGGATEFTTTDVQTVIANLTTNITGNGFLAGSNLGLDVSAPTTLSGVIADSTGTGAGPLGLVKTGAATLPPPGANTYSGETRIPAGVPAIGAGGSIANCSVIHLASGARFDVSAGAGNTLGEFQTLTGTGTVTGDLTIAGTLAIGNSPGTMAFDGDLTLDPTSSSAFEFTAASLGLNTFDLARGTTGTVTFGGALKLLFNSSETYVAGSSARIFDFAGYSNTFKSVSFSGLAPTQTASFDHQTGTVTIIPEPAAACLGVLGSLLLLRRRRPAANPSQSI